MAGFDGDDGPSHSNSMGTKSPVDEAGEAAELDEQQREVVASYNQCAKRARDDAHTRLKAAVSSQRALALSASAPNPGSAAALAGGFASPFDARVAALVQRWDGAIPNFDGDAVPPPPAGQSKQN